MDIDVSHVPYWTAPVIIGAVIWAAIIVLAVWMTKTGEESSGKREGGIGLLLVSLIIGSPLVFGAVGAGNWGESVRSSKVEQLEKKYDYVTLDRNLFNASLDGAYVQGFLADKGNGKFIALEGKP